MSIKGCAGNQLAGNATMMTPRHWLTWPSGAHFLPSLEEQAEREARSGGGPYCAALCEADGTKINVDLHDIESWKALQLGPFHPRSGIPLPLSAADEAFFAETLTRARAFRQLMTHDPSVDYPPMAVIAASNVQTPVTWVRASPDTPFTFGDGLADADGHVRSAPGDGRFDIATTGPPEGVPVVLRLTSDASHSGVAIDLPLIERALDALLAAAKAAGR